MAEDLYYSSRSDHKRKFDSSPGSSPSPSPSLSGRRSTGFSAPIIAPPPDAAAPPSYNSVPPPADGIQLAKQRAQEIAARIFSDAEAKRPKVENGSGADDSGNKGFDFDIVENGSGADDSGNKGFDFDIVENGSGADDSSNKGFDFDQPHNSFGQPMASQVGMNAPPSFASYGFGGSSKKVDIPNGRVGVIIGKSGETIKYLQVQSGARIQVTRDMDADPHSQCRPVELIGTPEQISKAEQLINEVLAEAAAGGPGIISARKFISTPTGSDHFSMKVPNNKVGLIIGKGGETIKTMQATSGARIQVIPLHLPPGDPSMERTVHIDGTNEQIESAKQLVNDVISEPYSYSSTRSYRDNRKFQNRPRNAQTPGVFRPPGPPTSWVPPGAPPMQQPGYGYMQPGAYPGQPPQYNMSQPPYGGYLPPTSTGWDQSSNSTAQQTTQVTGYDYYGQQQQPESSAPTDSSSYNYSQIPTSYSAPGSYGDSTFSHSAAGSQQGYGQAASYAQPGSQAGYAQPVPGVQTGYAQQGYGSGSAYSNTTGSAQDGSTQGAAQQTLPPSQSSTAPQGYGGQHPGYGMPPTSQPGYGSQPATQPGYGQSPQAQKTSIAQPVYGQGQQPLTTSQAGYAQTIQTYGQPAQASGYAQSGYGQSYVQQSQSYNDSYAGAYAQPSYSSDTTHGSYEAPSSAQAAPSGATKASPQS